MKISEKDFLEICKAELRAKLEKAKLPEWYISQVMTEKENHYFDYISGLSKYAWGWTLPIKLDIRRIMGI